MKNTVCLALMILTVLPGYAQQAANFNRSSDGDAVTALAQDYAAEVDGLLREVHASLQDISAQAEAGRLTPEQARELKLAATREMISRLDAVAAVYEAQLAPKGKVANVNGSVGGAVAADHATGKAYGTVSVQELKRESTAAVVTPHAGEAAR